MKKLLLTTCTSFCLLSLNAQTNPAAYNLYASDYSFTEWSEDSEAGTYPPSMIFHIHTNGELVAPQLEDEVDGDWLCKYNIGSRARVLGMGEEGFGFLNTGNFQTDEERCGGAAGAVGGYLGAAVMTLNTEGVQEVSVSYLLGLIAQAAEDRVYDVRLQYRTSPDAAWGNVENAPVFSSLGVEEGTTEEFTVLLPEDAWNQPWVQIRWKYYQNSTEGGGSRPNIRFDEISVTGSRTVNTFNRSKDQQTLAFYPNPVNTDYINFETYGNYAIYSVEGKLIQEVKNTDKINVNHLTSGVYVIRDDKGQSGLMVRL